ncbi:hypothetical protein NDU88_003588 [Pleurodeles waltl]|uniref:Uncharacterized protein n=1 Tax=Pleurodeles waltl TaxID=8319 RepID=A0AAV7W6N6_PLEWA|nr:hypothetical protein NDU88_003588 [Pleurodeles waltl]
MWDPRPTHQMLLQGPRLLPRGASEFPTATPRSCHTPVPAGGTPPAHGTINQKKRQLVVINGTIRASRLPFASVLVSQQC